jgi:hypothetical protein
MIIILVWYGDEKMDINDEKVSREKLILEIMVKSYYLVKKNNTDNNDFISGDNFISKIYELVQNEYKTQNVFFWNKTPQGINRNNIIIVDEDEFYEQTYQYPEYFETVDIDMSVGMWYGKKFKILPDLVNYFIKENW